MARAKKKAEESAGAPEWMVTFGDMMSLLLCFFVIIVSLSEIKQDEKFKQVMESLRAAFGNTGEIKAVISDHLEPNALLKRLQTIIIPQKLAQGDADDPGVRGKVFRVTDVREGIHVEIGGRISFARFSASLMEESAGLVARVAAQTIGHNTIIKVTGHATNEPLPPDSAWRDQWNLSYARARAVAEVLIANGIRPARIRLLAAGAEAPLKHQAFTSEERALNRRVEIVITEAVIEDFDIDTFTREEQESTDG